MKSNAQLRLLLLLVCFPIAAHAEYVRCTSPDGKSSTIQRGKCASPTDIQTPVNIVKPLPRSPAASGEFEEGLAAHNAQDYAKALKLFGPLAEQGHPTAQILLGDMYHNGQGVAKDEAQALAWFRKAAEGGNADAQTLLGLAYHEGHGIPKDDAQARLWLQKAASQGNANAKAALPQLGR